MMEDKAWEECAREISTAAKRFIATELNMPRCLKAEKIAAAVKNAEVIKDVNAALDAALSGNTGVVCVCGSLYLAGEAVKYFNNRQNNTCK